MSRKSLYYVDYIAKILVDLPLVLVTNIDEYLHVYCDCGVNLFPDQLQDWNVSGWNDFHQLKESKCGHNTCDLDGGNWDFIPRNIDCLMNREVKVGDDGSGSFWIRVKVFGYPSDLLHWLIQVRGESKSQTMHRFFVRDGIYSARWDSFIIRNEYILQTLRMISMSDMELRHVWMQGSPSRRDDDSMVNIRACLIRSLNHFQDSF